MDGWTIAWLAWIAAFVVIEGVAFARTAHGAGTLSANVWRWFAVKDKRHGWWIVARRAALVLFLLWLLSHLATGWP